FENGIAAPKWDEYWAKRWNDIYLATKDDQVLVGSLSLSPQTAVSDATHFGFHYQAPQGDFQLAMPKALCDILPHDTTVELLADYMAQTLSDKVPSSGFKVIAYEGVGKGAIASRTVG
ncbi:hypothetical protein ACVBKF_32080, partial [Shewanella sp. 0m-11]